jgi:hypothetical protein
VQRAAEECEELHQQGRIEVDTDALRQDRLAL